MFGLFIAFRNWMNSLGVAPFVSNLYQDLKDGLVLLQVTSSLRCIVHRCDLPSYSCLTKSNQELLTGRRLMIKKALRNLEEQ